MPNVLNFLLTYIQFLSLPGKWNDNLSLVFHSGLGLMANWSANCSHVSMSTIPSRNRPSVPSAAVRMSWSRLASCPLSFPTSSAFLILAISPLRTNLFQIILLKNSNFWRKFWRRKNIVNYFMLYSEYEYLNLILPYIEQFVVLYNSNSRNSDRYLYVNNWRNIFINLCYYFVSAQRWSIIKRQFIRLPIIEQCELAILQIHGLQSRFRSSFSNCFRFRGRTAGFIFLVAASVHWALQRPPLRSWPLNQLARYWF